MALELRELNDSCGRHVVHFEFPGYGLCQRDGLQPSPSTIDQWARAVACFLLACGVEPQQLVIMGRSIGTGPAAKLARYISDTRGPISCLFLHSPYKSIHAIVSDYAWMVGTLLIPNYWNSEAELKALAKKNVGLIIVHCPSDEIIPVKHGKDLFDAYNVPAALKSGEFTITGGHNYYDVTNDIGHPLRLFLARNSSKMTTYGRPHYIPPFAFSITPFQAATEPHDDTGSVLAVAADTPAHASTTAAPTGVLGSVWNLLCGCATPTFFIMEQNETQAREPPATQFTLPREFGEGQR